MKKLIFFFVLFNSFFLVNNNLYSQCDSGYTSVTLTMTVNNCNYEVIYCVKCPTGPVPGFLKIASIQYLPQQPPCIQTWSFQQVLNYISAELVNFTYIQRACAQLEMPPCSTYVPITIYNWICWEMELVDYFGEPTLIYRPCNYDAWCQETWKFCHDSMGEHVELLSGPTLYGNITCTLGAEEVNVPIELNQVSNCFHIHSLCNPQ